MPTVPGTKSSVALSPQQTLEKIGGLITEISDDKPQESEPAVPAASTAPPEPPASEQAPPAPSDKPDAPTVEEEEDETPVEVPVDGSRNPDLRSLRVAGIQANGSTKAGRVLI